VADQQAIRSTTRRKSPPGLDVLPGHLEGLIQFFLGAELVKLDIL
jgi:hypothetical protein